MFSVASLSLGDEDSLEKIHAACFPDPWDKETFRKFLKDRHTCGLKVLNDQGYPVGFILARRINDEAEILTFAVHPSFQRKGLGRRLLSDLQNHLGCNALFLEVAADNQAAIDLYRSLGFVDAGTRPNYYQRSPEVFMTANVMLWKPNQIKNEMT